MDARLYRAYLLGASLASEDREILTKTASPAAFRAAMAAFKAGKGVTGAAGAMLPSTVRTGWKYVAKPLLGMGEGKILPHATGALGFGLMSAAGAEGGLDNRLKAFAGGALGGLAFTAGGAALKPIGRKLFTPSASQLGKRYFGGMSGSAVKEMKSLKDAFKATEAQIAALKSQGKAINKGLQDTLKNQKSSYNNFLRSNNIDPSTMFARNFAAGVDKFKGTAAGFAASMAGGMYLSGLPEEYSESKQVLPYQNNVFSPGYQGGPSV